MALIRQQQSMCGIATFTLRDKWIVHSVS